MTVLCLRPLRITDIFIISDVIISLLGEPNQREPSMPHILNNIRKKKDLPVAEKCQMQCSALDKA